MITAATLFSGIGAPEVAMPEWHWPWHAEIEKFPSAVMAARHPNSINLGDVSADDFTERAAAIARPDVLVFGSPCQSYSVAGKRLGLDDPRGNLALVALGIIDRLKPDWFVFENVPGLLSSAEGRDFGLLLRTVDELGYSLAWTVLDAQYFGVAQRRARVFAVGYIGDWRYPAAVLFEPESLCGNYPPRREAGKTVAPTIASRPTGGGGLGTDFDCDGGLIAHALRADGFDASEDGTGRGTPLVPVAFNSNESFSSGDNYDIAPTMRIGSGGQGQPPAIAFSCKDHGADASDIAPTMRAMGHSGSHANAGGQLAIAVALRGRHGGATAELSDVPSALRASSGGGDKAHVLAFQPKASVTQSMNPSEISPSMGTSKEVGAVIGSAVRRLTPRECERLQGFPDDYTAITYRSKIAADGPRYKALGNSMAVPVMRWILSRINALHYDPQKDFTASLDEAYTEIKQRVAAGGPGWEPSV